jgi:hypothetical protein
LFHIIVAIQGFHYGGATALGGPRVSGAIDQKVLEHSQQQRTESPSPRVGISVKRIFEKTHEKRLGQVFGFLARNAVATEIREYRRSIYPAQAIEGIARLTIVGARMQHQAPTRGLEVTHGQPSH